MIRVLIPTDFSENSLNAIKYACELFKYQRSEFLVMHAFSDEVYDNTLELSRDFFEQFKEKVKDSVDVQLRKVVAEMLRISPNPRHNYEFVSVFDSLVDASNKLVNKHDIDVVVMGSKGESNTDEITFGSQTLQVLKYVNCPLLMVPQRYHKYTPSDILFPSNYLVPFKRREIKLVSNIAMNFAAKVHLLHVSKNEKLTHRQDDNLQFLESCMENNILEKEHIMSDDLVSSIKQSMTANEVNLLVMVNHRHSFMDSLLNPSAVDYIGLRIEIPFLFLQNLPR